MRKLKKKVNYMLRLIDLREYKALKQKDIVLLINTIQQYYSEYKNETRLIPIDRLIKLANKY